MTDKPLTLARTEAAALCGLTTSGFDVWVRKGIVPPAIAGTRRWSRAAIEAAINGIQPAAVSLDAFQVWESQNEHPG